MTPTMRDMERCLERAIIICMGRTRPPVSAQDTIHAIHTERGLAPTSISVHPYFPKDFLVVFDTHSTKERILQGGSIRTDCLHLLLRSWSRLAQAASCPLRFRVQLSLEGLLIHAWSLAMVSAILAPACWIESFDESLTSCADLSAFRLIAWSLNPSAIPKVKTLVIAEPELLEDGSLLDHGVQVFSPPAISREVREALSYKVFIHIHAVEDFSSIADPYVLFPPSSDDSGFGDLPKSNSDDSDPRSHFFPTTSGQVDGVHLLVGDRHEGGSRPGSSQAAWKLPAMVLQVCMPDLGPPHAFAWSSRRDAACYGWQAGTLVPPVATRCEKEKTNLKATTQPFKPVNPRALAPRQSVPSFRLCSPLFSLPTLL